MVTRPGRQPGFPVAGVTQPVPGGSRQGPATGLADGGHGGVSCASAPRIRAASSAAVPACTQIIGTSGAGARADAGRTAVHRRPPCGSHTAHAGNSPYKAMNWPMTSLVSASSPASASASGDEILSSPPCPQGLPSRSTCSPIE